MSERCLSVIKIIFSEIEAKQTSWKLPSSLSFRHHDGGHGTEFGLSWANHKKAGVINGFLGVT